MIERLLSRFFKYESINGHDRCPPYMHRWTLFQPRRPEFIKGFGIYVHKFVGDDWTRDLHDHPKRFISIGLKGRYREWIPTTGLGKFFANEVSRDYVAPWVRTFPATHRHRITMIEPGETCWTLVIVLRTVREWGFWTPHGWLHWREYVKPGSPDADRAKICPD